jgi:hypothetical protein
MPVKQGREGVRQEMHKFKHGELHSGSKTGPVVKDRKQAIAIALSEAGMSKRARGGLLRMPKLNMPRPRGFRGFKHLDSGGFINSEIPGRTDKHYVTVGSGSYVLPADHISALGQNNSVAGANVVKQMFTTGSKFGPRLRIPKFAGGGAVEPVPIVVAGGEMILPPEIVRRIGNGDLEKGHSVLDKWVMETRQKHVKKLKSLKPPKGSDGK